MLYKLCTISCLSFSLEPPQIVAVMQRRWLKWLGVWILLLVVKTSPSFAEDKIQAFVNPDGKIIFTNLVNNTPAPVAALPGDVFNKEVPVPLKTMVDTIAQTHGVDPALVLAVMKTESNFDRWAVSRKGALGLMQLIPETGRRFGVRDFFDPQQNVDGGVRYLRFLLEKFKGNVDLSLAAYNAGENLVQRLGRIPAIPETTNYVRRIRAMYKTKSARALLAPMAPAASMTPMAPVAPAPGIVASATAAEPVKEEPPQVYRSRDERGVVHFSNIEPPK